MAVKLNALIVAPYLNYFDTPGGETHHSSIQAPYLFDLSQLQVTRV